MEQTSGTSYPNALVIDYLRQTGKTNPKLMAESLHLLNVGVQRICTFQTEGGGFSWWSAQDTPRLWVTAYALHQLRDVEKVYEIDPRVIERAQKWLVSRQNAAGAWTSTDDTHGEAISLFPDPSVPLTAYVAWAFGETGYSGEALEKALRYIGEGANETNVYSLGLIANALVANGRDAGGVLERLAGLQRKDGSWSVEGATLSYARGLSGSVEATALIAHAMLRSRMQPNAARAALEFVLRCRNSAGAWGSTQATILALKCLLAARSETGQEGDVEVDVVVNGREVKLRIAPDQSEVMQLVDFKNETRAGANDIEIRSRGRGSFCYQIVGRAWRPWGAGASDDRTPEIEFQVRYDRQKLTTKDALGVQVTMKYHGARETYMVIADLGIPAGFTVPEEPFEKLKASRRIETYSITGRQIILYFGRMMPGDEVRFSYSLRPKHPLRVKTPESSAYEYYSPEIRTVTVPLDLEVKDAEGR